MTRPGESFATLVSAAVLISTFSSQSRSELKGTGLIFQSNLQVNRPQIMLLHTGLCLIFCCAYSQTSSGSGLQKGRRCRMGVLCGSAWKPRDEGQRQADPIVLQRETLEFGIDHVLIQIWEINSYLWRMGSSFKDSKNFTNGTWNSMTEISCLP